MEVSDEAYLMGKIIENVDKSYLMNNSSTMGTDKIIKTYKALLAAVRESKNEVKKTPKSKAINF